MECREYSLQLEGRIGDGANCRLDYGKRLGTAPCHDGVRGDLLQGGLSTGRGQNRNSLACALDCGPQHALDPIGRGRNDRKPVGPAAFEADLDRIIGVDVDRQTSRPSSKSIVYEIRHSIAVLERGDTLSVERTGVDMLFHHVHIKSPDPTTSADWWSKAFGLAIESDEVRPEGDLFVRCVSEQGVPVFISGPRPSEQPATAEPGSRFGLEHIGFHSDDITADIDRLVGMGATLVSGPERLASGKTIAFLHTPDRVRVELIQP